METVVFQTSLIAAFIAGMVALFAPCCITFLLPAYLGTVFKEKEKVLFMTLVFGLGIFVVLLPAVLGVAFISQSLFRYHDIIYVIGAVVMILVALTTFLGIKLPMPTLKQSVEQKADVLSIFTLGVFSGITSACCAPVLIGILTLTFLSPSFVGAVAIGGVYVLGMITPLLLISLFLHGKMPYVKLLRRKLFTLTLLGKEYAILTSNVIAAVIFFVTGWLILYMALTGSLQMSELESYTQAIQNTSTSINGLIGNNILLNLAFLGLILGFVYLLVKRSLKTSTPHSSEDESKPSCH